MSKQFLILVIALVMPLVAACSADVSLDFDEQYSYLTVEMQEEEVASMIERMLTSGDSQLQNVNADLRPGEVYVTAEMEADNGSMVPGELLILIGAAEGQLQVQVVSFSFAGISTPAERIAEWNQNIAEGLARGADNNERGSEFTQVSITDTTLSFTVRTPRRDR